MSSQIFIEYCSDVCKDKFQESILKGPIPENSEIFDVIISRDEDSYFKNIQFLSPEGVYILILSLPNEPYDDYHKIIKTKYNVKEKFKYHRFYHNPQANELYFLGLMKYSNQYIPDYISDYKLICKDRRKTVVVYTFHKYNESVEFFVKHGIFKSSYVDFIFVCNGTVKVTVPDYVKYINRENIGHDFGGWSHAIFNESLRDKYDFFILINCSVRGPFIPPWCRINNWTQIFTKYIDYQTKLVGTSIGIHEYIPHIQSMVLVFDKVGLDIGINKKIFEKKPIPMTRDDIIATKEIGFSQKIMKHGYKIRPLISSYHNTIITPKTNIKTLVHIANMQYFGTNMHPYDAIFIKDKADINRNRDIITISDNHNTNFDRLSTLPEDFNWRKYLMLHPDVAKFHACENGAINHWLNYGFSEKRNYK
jgi:hypothetical protein